VSKIGELLSLFDESASEEPKTSKEFESKEALMIDWIKSLVMHSTSLVVAGMEIDYGLRAASRRVDAILSKESSVDPETLSVELRTLKDELVKLQGLAVLVSKPWFPSSGVKLPLAVYPKVVDP
jgi:hypothetical protein